MSGPPDAPPPTWSNEFDDCVALGAVADDKLAPATAVDGFWYGLSKRSFHLA